MHTGHLDKHMWAFWWERLILINHICDPKVLDSMIGNKKFSDHKMRSKLPKSYQKKFAKSSCIDVYCLLSFVVKHQIWSHPKDWVCWSQRILKSNGVTKYCLYWWWMKLFMLLLSVGWKKEKQWKHSEDWLNTAATCFTKCIVLDGQVAISKLVTVS